MITGLFIGSWALCVILTYLLMKYVFVGISGHGWMKSDRFVCIIGSLVLSYLGVILFGLWAIVVWYDKHDGEAKW